MKERRVSPSLPIEMFGPPIFLFRDDENTALPALGFL